MSLCQSFPPVIAQGARILLLGSMPGEASLRAQQYYAYPRNAFWWIMHQLFGCSPELGYRQRLHCLSENGVALWDVLKYCQRDGSLDADIVSASEEPNDIIRLLQDYPSIQRIGFNGQKAYSVFRRHILKSSPELRGRCHFAVLPSSSPAHASLTPAQKLEAWREVLT